MSQGLVTDTYLTNLANAIRSKLGTQDTYTPAQMADAIRSIGGSAPEIVSWASGTDEQIVAMLEYAHANPNWSLETDGGWSVGDVRTITLGAFTDCNGGSYSQQSLNIAITSFDDYRNCGCVMQFDFIECPFRLVSGYTGKYGSFWNTTNTNVGGYSSSGTYLTTLPNMISALPSWLKDILVEFSCVSSIGNQSSTLETIQSNKLALRSASEVCGSDIGTFAANEGEPQLVYYQTQANRQKKCGHNGSDVGWLLRSPRLHNATDSCKITTNGGITGGAAWQSSGTPNSFLAPFGCL